MRTCRATIFAALLTLAVVSAQDPTNMLGRFPLCEASAALRLPCGEGDCLLVGDNEVRDRLYEFPIRNQDLEAQAVKELGLGDGEISDIEALVNLGSNRILVLGSHGRNKGCEPKKNRRRFLVVERLRNGIQSVGETVESKRITCERLLNNTDRSEMLKAVCESIDQTERQADSIFEALDTAGGDAAEVACGKAAPFNIEGAVAIPAKDGPEVWIGLRGPLVETAEGGERRRLAVMLRMKNLQEFSFDAAALVDLGGFAIRELTVGGGWVWGIAGPPEDSSVAFKLWRFPIRGLQADATIRPELLRELPTSSEGLALSGSTAFVVIDGDQGGNSCVEPARYQAIRVLNY